MHGQHSRLRGVEGTVGGLSGWYRRLELDKCDENRLATTRSMTSEMYGRFEMGLCELATSGSRLFFFSIGRTRPCFSGVGKTPLCSERLHRLQMTGAMCGVRRFKSHVGIGSSEQDLAGIV